MIICLTGVTRGIGRSLAIELAEPGNELLLISRDKVRLDELVRECNNKAGNVLAKPLLFDFSDAERCETELPLLISSITNRVDVLVNNAGILINKPFDQFTTGEARRLFEVNFFASGALIRGILPLLCASDDPQVLNISSMGGITGSTKFAGLSYYSASKAALAVLTEVLAVELSEMKIRVNAIAPGAVQTEMLGNAFPGYKAPVTADEMGKFLKWFIMEGSKFFNGKVIPVSSSVP